jgi:hypothetical protein
MPLVALVANTLTTIVPKDIVLDLTKPITTSQSAMCHNKERYISN